MIKINNKILILIVILASVSVFAFISGCISDEAKKYKYFEKVGGINVYSDIPISEVENWDDDVLLIHKNNTAIIGCNLELSAVSQSNYKGPEIHIEEGDKTGIYIHKNSAEIKGKNNIDIMNACHSFVCLKEGIVCPENLNKIRDIIDINHLNVILDNKTEGKSVHGYIEMFEAIGHMQINSIDLYLMDDDTCKLQRKLLRVSGVYQEINISNIPNKTVNNCNIDGIFIQKSDKNEIKIEGKRIILLGDDEHLHSEEILVSDLIAPDLRLGMHK